MKQTYRPRFTYLPTPSNVDCAIFLDEGGECWRWPIIAMRIDEEGAVAFLTPDGEEVPNSGMTNVTGVLFDDGTVFCDSETLHPSLATFIEQRGADVAARIEAAAARRRKMYPEEQPR